VKNYSGGGGDGDVDFTYLPLRRDNQEDDSVFLRKFRSVKGKKRHAREIPLGFDIKGSIESGERVAAREGKGLINNWETNGSADLVPWGG